MPAVATTSDRLHCEHVRIFILQAHRELDGKQLFVAAGVEHTEHNQGYSERLKDKVGGFFHLLHLYLLVSHYIPLALALCVIIKIKLMNGSVTPPQ